MTTGDIYSRQKCPLCGSSFAHDPKKRALVCPAHKNQQATGGFYVKFGRAVNKRFPDYEHAVQFLNGLRFKSAEGSFDAKDYRADQPYAFAKLAELFLEEKKKLASFKDVRRHMEVAVAHWGRTSVKDIRTPDIKRFLNGLDVSDKTRANYRSTIHDFFTRFLVEEEVLETPAKVPGVTFELGYRTVTDVGTQGRILGEVRRIASNPKVGFGIDLLRTYIALRPGDLARLTEADITSETITCWHPTKKKNARKVVRLLPEHGEMVRDLKARFPAMPSVPFFRHHGGVQAVKPGQPFGEKHFYKWWKRACENLGVVGLDLYGGTRHTTTTALAIEVGEAGAKEATGHETNKAFHRYCQAQEIRALEMAKVVRGLHHGRTTKTSTTHRVK